MAKILLVEDNEMNRDMLSRRLMRKGYEVLIAVDGEEGVRMARSSKPAARRLVMSSATTWSGVRVSLTAWASMTRSARLTSA